MGTCLRSFGACDTSCKQKARDRDTKRWQRNAPEKGYV